MPAITIQHERIELSRAIRIERGDLHRKVEAGTLLLSGLILADHPVVRGVRCYKLVAWLRDVGPKRTTRLVRGLPGHAPLCQLTPMQRDCLIDRIQAYERRRGV